MKNPLYASQMLARRDTQKTNREIAAAERISGKPMGRLAVPKQPNRYLPHTGAKQIARIAARKAKA